MDTVFTRLGKLLATGQGYPVQASSAGKHTLTLTLLGTGAVAFAGTLMGSNDNAGWVAIAPVAASGTSIATSVVRFDAEYKYWRLDCTTLTGTSAEGLVATDPNGDTLPALMAALTKNGNRDAAGRDGIALAGGTNTASTRELIVSMAAPFAAARVHVRSSEATTSAAGDMAFFATETEFNANPRVNGGAGVYVPVTWDGGQSTFTYPTRISSSRQGRKTSDWVAVGSVPQLPAEGNRFLLGLRLKFSVGGWTYVDYAASWPTVWGGISEGRVHRMYQQSGSFVTTDFTSASAENVFPHVDIETLTTAECKIMAGTGDSTVQGSGSGGTSVGNDGVVPLAAHYMTQAGVPCGYVNVALQGSKASLFNVLAADALPTIAPTYVCIPLFSRNESASPPNPTDADVAAGVGGAVIAARRALADGSLPILMGPTPQGNGVQNDLNAASVAKYFNLDKVVGPNIAAQLGCLFFSRIDGIGATREDNYRWPGGVSGSADGIHHTRTTTVLEARALAAFVIAKSA